MGFLDDWHDYVRLFAFLISCYSVVALVVRYRMNGYEWNVKTTDYWFALLMWSLAGGAFCLQGIIMDRPVSVAFVFQISAVLVTGKGLARKGDWGGHDS